MIKLFFLCTLAISTLAAEDVNERLTKLEKRVAELEAKQSEAVKVAEEAKKEASLVTCYIETSVHGIIREKAEKKMDAKAAVIKKCQSIEGGVVCSEKYVSCKD